MSTTLHLIDAPTVGKRIKLAYVYDGDLQPVIQGHADNGYNFVGIIERITSQMGHTQTTLLFTRNPE